MNFERFVDIARALKLTHQTGRAFHCSFAVKQKKIIEIGINHYDKTNPISVTYRPKKVSTLKHFIPGTHSEISLLGKLKRLDDLSNLILVNVRINNNNLIDNSCPCVNCAWHVAKAGFKRVYYSTPNGFLEIPY